MPNRYPAEVFWSDDDEGFIAVARDLPGCSAFGETRLEALDEFDHAVEAWIQAAQAAGNPVPEPSVRSAEPRHSGKLLVRLPRTLHSKLAEEAEREAVSLNQYVVWRLSENACSRSFQSAAAEIIGTAVRAAVQNSGIHICSYEQHTVGTGAVRILDIARMDHRGSGLAAGPMHMLGSDQFSEGAYASGCAV